ncbi:MAG: hypothetical protein GC189_11340 [Alphaproteobacteria bacterium]|nr:hypothetical protein [Alphaproteobacteria bacterium]
MIPALIPYDFARALHLIFVIAWMAGMLMLPRMLAYQTESTPGGELDAKMAHAADRLRTIIVNPSMIAVWIFGLYLAFAFHAAGQALLFPLWLWIKIALLLGLTGWHGYVVAEGKRMAKGERRRSARFWRMTNEIPFLIAIAAVLLATLEPRLN